MMTQDLTEVDFRAQMKHRSRCQVCLHGMIPPLCEIRRSRIQQRFAFSI